ncbi:hypothetical protein D3C85_1790080 [compost metagenome]
MVHVSRIEHQSESRRAWSGEAGFIRAGQVVQTGRFDLVDSSVDAVDRGDAAHVKQGASVWVDRKKIAPL